METSDYIASIAQSITLYNWANGMNMCVMVLFHLQFKLLTLSMQSNVM